MTALKRDYFTSVLSGTTDQTDVTLLIETEAKLKKSGNPFTKKKVTKHMLVNVRLNADYASEVNERRADEGVLGGFKADQLSWGTRVLAPSGGKTPLVEHEGRLYILCQVLNSGPTTYMVDGVPATQEELAMIKVLTPTKNESSKQGIESPVIVRTFKLDSVLGLVVGGRTVPLI